MFDMFGDVGIFGDTLMPVMNVKENKETKAKEKEIPKKEKAETYKGPITVLFDSMGQIQIEGEKEYTKEQLIDEISEITNCSIFKEHEKQFDLKKIKDSVFLYRPINSTKYEKGNAGKYLLLESSHKLDEIIEVETEIDAETVKTYLLETYGIKVCLYLVGNTYIPVPDIKAFESYDKISFPVYLKALTLFGEHLEITEDDYKNFLPDKETQSSLIEEQKDLDEVIVDKKIFEKIIKTLLPEYSYDYVLDYDEDAKVIVIGHKNNQSVQKAAATVKEELYPTDASVSLIFTKLQLTSSMFGGKKEITKKELLKHIAKQYPEYSPERTELIYDKKQKLIIPSFKSGKRGSYFLNDNEEYRLEETPIMRITAYKERKDIYGCVKGEVIFKLPKIPFKVLDEIIKFFIRVYKREGTEAIAMIFFDKQKEEYEIYIPNQRASAGFVEFDRDRSLECDESKYLVMEIHSHGSFGAFWSQTDNEDELAHRLYAVAGNMDSFDYASNQIIVRAATGGLHVKTELKDIFCL